MAEQKFLQLTSRSKFEAIFGSDMRPLFGFSVCCSAWLQHVRTSWPVIKDSEAVQYVGKKVEVRGFVVSVTTSPLGTAFINFGREYPNQTFAGFIAAGSKKCKLSPIRFHG
jgi:hypothetical protein